MPRKVLSEDERRERLRLKAKRWRDKNPGYKSGQYALAKQKYREAGKAKDRMRKHKLLLVSLFGGRCQCCGGSFHYSCLDFHHKNKADKERQVKIDRGWKTLAVEAAKCVMLCANCHRLYHYFERNPDCETVKSFAHLEKLNLLRSNQMFGPDLATILEAKNRLPEAPKPLNTIQPTTTTSEI